MFDNLIIKNFTNKATCKYCGKVENHSYTSLDGKRHYTMLCNDCLNKSIKIQKRYPNLSQDQFKKAMNFMVKRHKNDEWSYRQIKKLVV